MDQTDIAGRLRKIIMLPTFPNIVGEVISVIEDPKSSASDLARHMDPSMVGEVLRIANTAYFGTRNFRNITAIEQAIAVIGFEHLSYTVLQMPFLTMVKGDGDVFDRRDFIKHSITCGVMGRCLSAAFPVADANEVYVSGIMHDIGAIVMYRYFKDQWRSIAFIMENENVPRLEAERKVFSFDHGYMGATLLEMWNIPKPVTDAVMFHHNPERATENAENVMVTHLANTFSKKVDFENDFGSFDDFLGCHRYIVNTLSDLGKEFSPSEEVRFLERLYLQLKDAKHYLAGVTEGDDDKGSCC
jgi:HD-like signal output (HDOD) protein